MHKNKDMNAKIQRKYMHLYSRKRAATVYLLCAGVAGSAYGLSFADFAGIEAHSLCSGADFLVFSRSQRQ